MMPNQGPGRGGKGEGEEKKDGGKKEQEEKKSMQSDRKPPTRVGRRRKKKGAAHADKLPKGRFRRRGISTQLAT